MSKDKETPTPSHQRPGPLVEEKGLQPAQNPPPMPVTKPPKLKSDS